MRWLFNGTDGLVDQFIDGGRLFLRRDCGRGTGLAGESKGIGNLRRCCVDISNPLALGDHGVVVGDSFRRDVRIVFNSWVCVYNKLVGNLGRGGNFFHVIWRRGGGIVKGFFLLIIGFINGGAGG